MSKGYLIFVQGPYNNMAELLSRSIKATQSTVNDVCIIQGNSGDVMYNRTRAYDLSPFDETVMLDADMLFLEDVSHWWDHFAKFPLLITNKVRTYRGDLITDTPYRSARATAELPLCYCAITYFKKDPVAEEFFDTLGDIVSNWTYQQYQPRASIDIAMGIACNQMDIQPFSPLDYPTFTHMKSGVQGWTKYSENWRQHVNLTVESGKVTIGNYVQRGILHYVDKGIVSELSRAF
jgi:hypothetical protein